MSGCVHGGNHKAENGGGFGVLAAAIAADVGVLHVTNRCAQPLHAIPNTPIGQASARRAAPN